MGKNKNFIKKALVSCAILFPGISCADNVIFDLNGVLLTQSGSAWEIGITNFLGLFNPLRIQDNYFDFMNRLRPRLPETPIATNEGRLLPQIMCDWLCGTASNQEIRTEIHEKLKKHTFDSERKANCIGAIADYMFTPERFAKTIVPVKSGIKLLQKCKTAGHKIYILSNWDAESFDELLKTNNEIYKYLDLADGVIISGRAQCMKPDTKIFDILFETYNINPDEELTVFIDDEDSNIKAAQSMNKKKLRCIHCKNFDYKKVKKSLITLGVIKK